MHFLKGLVHLRPDIFEDWMKLELRIHEDYPDTCMNEAEYYFQISKRLI